MIKECNFKKDKICVLVSTFTVKDEVNYMPCSGEENCILFQIYANNSILISKEIADANFNKIMEIYGPTKYDVKVGTSNPEPVKGSSYHLFQPKKSKRKLD